MENMSEQSTARAKLLDDFVKARAELKEANELLEKLTEENERLQTELVEKQVVVQNLFSYISNLKS